MNERILRRMVPAVTLASALFVSACSPPESAAPTMPPLRSAKATKGSLPRCYEDPLKSLKPELLQPLNTVYEYPFDASTDTLAGDPVESSAKVNSKVKGAIVQVMRPDIPRNGRQYSTKGSGFILKSRGSSFVVTAAHVVMPAKINQLQVIDNTGNTSGVDSGCFIYENSGVQHEPTLDGSWRVQMDIAVLKLSTPLGKTALSLADTRAKRGDWGAFYNYQGANSAAPGKPGNPAQYAGIYARTDGNDRVITGVQPWRQPPTDKAGQLDASQALQGSSGGVVFDPQSGDVWGMSYAGVDSEHPVSAQELLDVYGVALPGVEQADTGHVLPTPAILIDTTGIQTALNAPILRN